MFVKEIINFGYWKRVLHLPIPEEERFESEKELYRVVAETLNLTGQDSVLEVGCGFGFGAGVIMYEFRPLKMKGIDISTERIARAKIINKGWVSSRLMDFQLERAESLLCENCSFDKIFSIEAIQHFESCQAFIHETYRSLKPQGRLVIASIFTPSMEASRKAEELLPFKVGIVRWIPVKDLYALLCNAGFKNVRVRNIGEHVWEPINHWISQNNLSPPWNEWYNGYKKGLYDYYIISADKNESTAS